MPHKMHLIHTLHYSLGLIQNLNNQNFGGSVIVANKSKRLECIYIQLSFDCSSLKYYVQYTNFKDFQCVERSTFDRGSSQH